MHEVSLCRSLVRIMEDEAARQGFRRVRTAYLDLGALSCVESAALRFAFESCTRGTCADGAELVIAVQPARAWCWDCAGEIAVTAYGGDCPACGGGKVQLLDGQEMRLRELEVQ